MSTNERSGAQRGASEPVSPKERAERARKDPRITNLEDALGEVAETFLKHYAGLTPNDLCVPGGPTRKRTNMAAERTRKKHRKVSQTAVNNVITLVVTVLSEVAPGTRKLGRAAVRTTKPVRRKARRAGRQSNTRDMFPSIAEITAAAAPHPSAAPPKAIPSKVPDATPASVGKMMKRVQRG